MTKVRNASFSVLLAALGSPAVVAQTAWERVPLLDYVMYPATAFDAARGRLVVFGGYTDRGEQDATWEWDGMDWHRMQPSVAPSARQGAAAAYDPVRGRVVLFGGANGQVRFADTWEWDGATWTLRQPPDSPPARSLACLAFDGGRQRLLLFGGRPDAAYEVDDTWEWDGTTWTQLQPAHRPGARAGAAMAYDLARARMVLFGGSCFLHGLCFHGSTWEWDGVDWVDRTPPYPAATPAPRWSHGMAYDAARARVVLFGGSDEPSHYKYDTWQWDGVAWTELALAAYPVGRLGFGMVWDSLRQRTLVFGGISFVNLLADLWAFDAAGWREVHPGVQPPIGGLPRGDATWDGDRGAVVWLGNGYIDPPSLTWEFRGEAWRRIAAGAEPAVSDSMRIGWLPPRQRLVAYRPRESSTPDQTWTWDGAAWTRQQPAHSPGIAGDVALALDPARDRLVLFGGSPAATFWFDGVDWTAAAPTASPTARGGHAMVLDQARRRVVLFGGSNGSAFFGDTWEWDGGTWQQLAPPTAPSARDEHGLAYDAGRRRTILQGGRDVTGRRTDTWEWDGGTWTLRSPAGTAPTSSLQRLQYDPERGQAVLLGMVPSGTFRYGPVHAGTFATFGQGCGGSAGVPILATEAAQRPYVGTHFDLLLDHLPGSVAFGALGWSNTSWFGLAPLPMSLSPFGYPNCALVVQTDSIAVLSLVSGAARWTTWIPNDAAFVGVEVFAQAMAFDPIGPDGLAMTRGGACVVGGL